MPIRLRLGLGHFGFGCVGCIVADRFVSTGVGLLIGYEVAYGVGEIADAVDDITERALAFGLSVEHVGVGGLQAAMSPVEPIEKLIELAWWRSVVIVAHVSSLALRFALR